MTATPSRPRPIARRSMLLDNFWWVAALVGAAALAVVVAIWHVACVMTLDFVSWGDFAQTWRDVLHRHPVGAGRSVTDHVSTIVVFVVLLLVVVVASSWAITRVALWWTQRRSQRPGMGSSAETDRSLGRAAARRSAGFTRPSLSAKEVRRADVSEVGLLVGRTVGGRPVDVVLPFTDHLAVFSLSGSGKTTRVVAPAALTAPGALIVTSNEVGIVDLIAEKRASVGRVWVFDPLGRTRWPEPMVWNPVKGCEDGAVALARATAFAQSMGNGSDSTNSGFFRENAATALKVMFHAAALAGEPMRTVTSWARRLDSAYDEPNTIIRDSSHPLAEPDFPAELTAVATGASDTIMASRNTLMQTVKATGLREVMAWLTPRAGVDEFDPAAFVSSRDTLVLISDDTAATNVGPLTTMLFQEVMDTLKKLAPDMPLGRLDPPLRVVGDEFANVAPVVKAPELSSDVRKFGVQLVLVFQSRSQVVERWGRERAEILIENMAAELVLPGLSSGEALQRYEGLAGDVDVWEATQGAEGGIRQVKVLPAEAIRTLADDQALLVWRNAVPVIVKLTAWYEGPDKADLEAGRARTAAWRRDRTSTGDRDRAARGWGAL